MRLDLSPFSPPSLRALIQERWGDLAWWPADTPFEVCVGAILTQNTAWTNVERALEQLRQRDLLDLQAMAQAPLEALAQAVRPSGYYKQKSARLKSFAAWLLATHGSAEALGQVPEELLRAQLLNQKGIGPETADSMLCYAAGHPRFVVDAYTHRILSRHSLPSGDYANVQAWFESQLPADAKVLGNIHAGIVELGKTWCRPHNPYCEDCPLGPTH